MYGGVYPGLKNANDWISRDEGHHTNFGILLYKKTHGLDSQYLHNMFGDAVETEIEFVNEIFGNCRYPGMNADLMIQYVKFVADQLLLELGCQVLYGEQNPFSWMNLLWVSVRTPDFFTRDSSEYNKSGVSNNILVIDDDF
jgi:ribonucleoside-diphosphate reductase subunit M2